MAILLVWAVAAGATGDRAGTLDPASDWRLASARPPTPVEYAALVAACEDFVGARPDRRLIDTCLRRRFAMRPAP